ncbi:hypothetical protein EBU58_04890 [bacterium]|nr:hypothetical protein [bacterium]
MLDFSQGFSPATHLLVTLAAPLVGALAAWLLGHRGLQAVRQSAAVTSLITLGLAGSLVLRFLGSEVPSEGGFFAAGELGWFVNGPFDIRFSVGLDGLSIWLFGLSALLTVTAVFVSWDAVKEKAVGFYGLLLLLEAAMLGVFAARDIILFYVFFEFTLVPLFFLIGIWGHDDRRRAAVKFFIYTFAVLRHCHADCRPEQPPTADDTGVGLPAAVGVSRPVCRLCDQGADRAGAHLVATGTRGSPHRRQCRPCRRTAEDRHLRFPQVLAADAARGRCSGCPMAGGTRCRWHHLRGTRGLGAERPQANGRLLISQPYGLLRNGTVCPGACRGRGRQPPAH